MQMNHKQISQKFVPNGPIDKTHRRDKPLFEPMVTRYNDAYMQR